MNIDIVSMTWLLVAALTSAVPVAAAKQFSNKKELIWILISIISCGIMIYSYTKIFNNSSDISAIYPLIKCFSIAMIVVFGILVFNEAFSYKKCLGLSLGVASIYLLSGH